MPDIPPGRYRHFKGNEYEVLGTALHSETREPHVVYRPLYGDGGLWIRPAAMFAETVERDGAMVARFERITSPYAGPAPLQSPRLEVVTFLPRDSASSS